MQQDAGPGAGPARTGHPAPRPPGPSTRPDAWHTALAPLAPGTPSAPAWELPCRFWILTASMHPCACTPTLGPAPAAPARPPCAAAAGPPRAAGSSAPPRAPPRQGCGTRSAPRCPGTRGSAGRWGSASRRPGGRARGEQAETGCCGAPARRLPLLASLQGEAPQDPDGVGPDIL